MNQLLRAKSVLFAILATALLLPQVANTQGRLKLPETARQTRQGYVLLGDQAKLAFDLGDFTAGYTIKHVAPPGGVATKVTWDVSGVRGANGVIFEVARSPFGPDRNPNLRPRAIVSAERSDGKLGSANVNIAQIARDAGYLPPQASTGSRRLTRPDARQEFMRNGGHFTLFLRVVPVASASNPSPVGLASPELRIIFANNPPSGIKFPSTAPKQPSKPSPVECLGIRYAPVKEYCVVHPNPSVCAKVGQGKPWYEEALDTVLDAWDWACDTYAAAKKAVVDIASSALPFVPREAFEMALDGALAACGMPPNIPNLDQLMDQGADYLAGEIVAQIGPPAAGDLAKEQIKKALIAGAKAAAQKVGSAGPEKACQYTIEWPYLVCTIRNKSNQPVGPLSVSAYEWTGIYATNDWDGRLFKTTAQTLSHLSPGASLPVFLPLMPSMKQKKHYVQGVHKEAVYWQDYNTVPTNVDVTVSASYDPDIKNLVAKTGKRLFNKPFQAN